MHSLNKDQRFFWEIVEEIGWETKTVDYHAVKKDLVKRYSKFTLEIFCKQYKLFYNGLKDAIKDYNAKNNASIPYSGRDAHWDTLSHIVGLGYDEYMKNINNPKRVEERLDSSNYVENFCYCFGNGNIVDEVVDNGKLGIASKEEI